MQFNSAARSPPKTKAIADDLDAPGSSPLHPPKTRQRPRRLLRDLLYILMKVVLDCMKNPANVQGLARSSQGLSSLSLKTLG